MNGNVDDVPLDMVTGLVFQWTRRALGTGMSLWWLDQDARSELHNSKLPVSGEASREYVIRLLRPLIADAHLQCVDVLERGVRPWEGRAASHVERIKDEWAQQGSIRPGDICALVSGSWHPESIVWDRGVLNSVDSAAMQAQWLYDLGPGNDDISLFDLASYVDDALAGAEPRTVRGETFRLLEPLLLSGKLVPMELRSDASAEPRAWAGDTAQHLARIAEGWPVEAKVWDGPPALWTYFVAGPFESSR